MDMQVSYDPYAGGTYVALSAEAVARTVEISDLVMVDVDASGQPVGVEFAMAPREITDAAVDRVLARFPELKDQLLDLDRWLLTRPAS